MIREREGSYPEISLSKFGRNSKDNRDQTLCLYSYGSTFVWLKLGQSRTHSRDSLMIAVCIGMLFGSPALDPIGTCGAVILGAPCCLAIGGRAAITQQLMPASSQHLVTIVAER